MCARGQMIGFNCPPKFARSRDVAVNTSEVRRPEKNNPVSFLVLDELDKKLAVALVCKNYSFDWPCLLITPTHIIVAECLSARHLILLCCRVAFACVFVYVCMYVCIYVQWHVLARVITPVNTHWLLHALTIR